MVMKKIKVLSLLILLTSILSINLLNETYATVTVEFRDSGGADAFNLINSLQEVLVG